MKTFYVTTPIYYPSDYLHIGHCYTTVAADVLSRFKRHKGYDVFFLTGTDEHGEKIAKKAEEKGVSPKEYVDHIVDSTKELWSRLGITYSHYIRTTDDYHERIVQKLFTRLYEQGDIYKGEYKGWYCVTEEAYFTESQAIKKDGKYYCPSCDSEVELTYRSEEAYFLRLSKYGDWLISHLKNNPGFLEPKERVSEMINNFLSVGLEDLAVSRTSIKWGVEVPFDKKHVIYVWVDALSNYITALGYSENEELFNKYWPADVHLIGKEIVRFHAIIWPIMLKMLGLPLPKKIFGHGWLLIDGGKMSKSKGNVVEPMALADKYGVDAIRYFLTRDVVFGSDGHYTQEAFIKRFNADLANDLGNLLNRSTAMLKKYFDGVVPALDESIFTDEDKALKESALALSDKVESLFNNMRFSEALSEIWAVVSRANKYIEVRTPWNLAKENSPELANVIVNILEVFRIVVTLASPVLIEAAEKVSKNLNIPLNWSDGSVFNVIKAGSKIEKAQPLFPRIDIEEEIKTPTDTKDKKVLQEKEIEEDKKEEGEISFDDFLKMDIRVAKVLEAERVEGTDKLLKMTLSIGKENRTVVSGIYPHYSAEDMLGKKVVYLSNLKPRKIKGILSQGMILAANGENAFSRLSLDKDVEEGTRIS